MKKYSDIQVEKTGANSFMLLYNDEEKDLIFNSAEIIESTDFSILAPTLQVKDKQKGLDWKMFWAEEAEIKALEIRSKQETILKITSEPGQVSTIYPYAHLATGKERKLMRTYERKFKKESRLFGVKKYDQVSLASLAFGHAI